MTTSPRKLAALAGALVCLLMPASADAQSSVADFYKGKSITIQVGAGSGGGYDLDARISSRHLGKYIPGNPQIVVTNILGARGLTSINRLYAVAPRDGTAMAVVQRNLIASPWILPQGVQYDVTKMNWLFSTGVEGGVALVWHTAKSFNLKDIRETEVVVGGAGDSSIIPQVFNFTTGSKFKLVTGYKGSADIVLAMLRQEVEGMGYYSWNNVISKNPEWIKENKVRVLLQTNKTRAPDRKDVPTVWELATSPAMRQVQELWLATLDTARPYVMPPEVPAERVEALRKAFGDMVKDDGYRADMAKSGMVSTPSPGSEINALISRLAATPKDVIELARKAAVE